MRLFAERGYRDTTIAAIESAAGLSPRSGALYLHFDGKDAVLRAAIESELAELDRLPTVLTDLPSDDLRGALTALAEWNLRSLSRRRALYQFLARDGDRLSKSLRKEMVNRLVNRPYEQIVEVLKSALGPSAGQRLDLPALAVVFVQSMAGYRSLEAVFGEVPGNVDDERFISAWVDAALAVAREPSVDLAGR